ncbi:Transcription initiation factor TFIID [Gracilaria domingensis]|nr:Transcription initiation factor TFIID [Gracilaria domingensis]
MVTSAKPDKTRPPVFHPVELARGWRILRQHLSLHADVRKRTLTGTAHFTLCALNVHFVSICLNLRRCRINSCEIANKPAPYRLISPLDDDQLLDAVSSQNARQRVVDVDYSMRQRHSAATDQGELVIDLPVSVTADLIDDLKELIADTSPQKIKPEDVDLESNTAPPVALDKLPIVHLKVDYQVLDPTAGAMFYGNLHAENPVIDPLYMLTESRFGMARFWMPCLDTINWYDRCLFDLDVTVESHLFAVASGELYETIALPPEASPSEAPAKLYRYSLYAPALASEIILAVGPFIPLPDPTVPHSITHFCLPGFAKELVHTAPPLLAKSLAFCRDYFGADPPICSYKQIFVGSLGLDPNTTVTGAGGIVVLSGDLLHTPRCIDEAFAAREAIMNGVVMTYSGRFLRPRLLEDDWLITGLAAHVSTLGLQTILGRNWYTFRIWDIMEQLRNEPSLDLADSNLDRITDSSRATIRKRSHMIVYMIAKRIGGDVLKRALRDIVAEGRSTTIAAVSKIDAILTSPSNGTLNSTPDNRTLFHRKLADLINANLDSSQNHSVVTSGFDDAIQGVGVGPFLKRIRGIIGTDVRNMVRQWASHPGIPRLQVAYHYNARKHTIELAIKQESVGSVSGKGKQGLRFTGTINIRVMETEGEYDHSVEVSDSIFITEIPCHSRRAKHKSGAQAEKEFNENPARASPILWIRFDPDQEWCMDCNFRQTKSAWISVLNSGRDAMGQFEACRGLAGSGHQVIVNKLLTVLKDEQIYWRVRAEAAKILSSTDEGLKKLLSYFWSCYSEKSKEGSGILLPNSFSNFANYYVKRAMISSIAESRVKGSRTVERPQGSISVEATEFLSSLLSGHDNAGNDFDDDHFLSDLFGCCSSVSINCLGDQRHTSAGYDGCSTSDSLIKLLERFRAIEHMVPRRSGLVKSSLLKALSDIEVAKLSRRDVTQKGLVARSIIECKLSHDPNLIKGLYELSGRNCSVDSRYVSALCLANIYGGDLEIVLWILTRVDSASSGTRLMDVRKQLRAKQEASAEYAFVESPVLRYKLVDALCNAARVNSWYKSTSPIALALRRHTRRAMQVCIRLQRLMVGDPDPRVRASAFKFAKLVWGSGIPVCLLSNREYREKLRVLDVTEPSHVVPLKVNASTLPPQLTEPRKEAKPSKLHKSSKSSKHGKNGKVSLKPSKKHSIKIPLGEAVGPIAPVVKEPSLAPIDVDATVSLSAPRSSHRPPLKSVAAPVIKKPPRSQPVSRSKPPSSKPPTSKPSTSKPSTSKPPTSKPPTSKPPTWKPSPRSRDAETKSMPLFRSVPPANSKRTSPSKTGLPPKGAFSWDPLDSEDLGFLRKAWEERKSRLSRSTRPSFRSVPVKSKPLVSAPKPVNLDAPSHIDDGSKSLSAAESDEVVFVARGEGGLENGVGNPYSSETKKKKKRKRSEDEVREGKKKKKKKKKHNRDEFGEGDSSRAGGDGDDNRKVGKFKIKFNGALAHVARSE